SRFANHLSIQLMTARSTPMRSATASWLRRRSNRNRRVFAPKSSRMSIRRIGSIRVFGAAFTHDPQGSFYEQTIFWAPEAMPTVLPIVRNVSASEGVGAMLPLAELASASIKQAPDGWHAVLRIQGAQHHLWLKEAPQLSVS